MASKTFFPCEWIDVHDRLPEEDGRYLVCVYYHVQYEHPYIKVLGFAKNLHEIDKFDFPKDKYNRSGFYGYDGEAGFFEQNYVTHWMPLPELPKAWENEHLS